MSHPRRSVVWLPLLLLLLAAVLRTIGVDAGEDLLIQRNYAAAAATFQQLLPGVPVGQQDRVLLLLGEAQLLAGDPTAATATLQRLLQEQPGSGLVPAAHFLMAKAHERTGDLRSAALVYRAEIERLCGFQRKEEVAALYLGQAEKAQQQEPPDWQRVVTFCDLAVDLGLDQQRAYGIRLKAAEAVLALGDAADASQRLTPLVERLDVAGGKLRAMLALGRARRLANDWTGARNICRDLQAIAGDAPQAADAAYEIALSFGVPQPSAALLDRAVAALEDLRRRYPSHPQAKIASFLAAQCQANLGRGDAALASLRQFLGTADAAIDEVPTARAMIGDVLASQGRFEQAIPAWREYLSLHPSHGDWERVQRAIVDAEWRLATDDYQAGSPDPEHAAFARARERFAAFARAYPLDPRNPDILLLLGDMLRQESRFDEAREAFERCVSKYPGKDQSSQAQYAIGEIFETKTFHYDRALQAYRAVTWGPMANAAQRRIQVLVQKHLHVATERVARTDEVPTFQVTSRNIESVRVRVYRLELEDYFRATHQTGQVERLDIEVIAPDQTFDSAVPEYVRYRETGRSIELPFREPGAYVVKVDDKELEATTLVLVSDLALIAKSSRHEFLVFTQNTRSSQLAAGVRVVLSDGQKVVAEGVTGADGVYRCRSEELKNRDDLRVFAVDASGSGATTMDLSGMGYSVGLLPKGYLFADRPLYQPGERVHLKGIVREVENGLYRLPAASDYRVQVLSPAGRIVLQSEVAFTAFGTFAVDVDLPATAATGDWRIAVDRSGHPELSFAGTFAVAKYERPRLQLAFELTESVVLRGEPIRGRVLARWFYGEPVVGRELVVRMRQPDGSVIERKGTTNAAGELAIDLPTSEFAEEALAQLSAAMPAEGVAADLVVPVVTTEFAPRVTVQRQVYLADEPFEVTTTLTDPSSRPLQRTVTATLLRLELNASGAITEVEQEQRELTTGQDGQARTTFLAHQGGPYRVRIAGKDRFGNVTSGDVQLLVSGADDAVRLRLLCDRETWKVGETATVRVINRAGPRLALLTWQGDGILAYEARLLADGEQALPVPMRPELAPNFALSVSMVDGKRLHTADREFTVTRDLQVDVEVPAEARPGGEVEVTVRTRDPQGQPVAAELAVAMVDEALLALHGDCAPAIGAFFYGTRRETAFRTQSSCTWSYDAPSHHVNEALQAEDSLREQMALKVQAEADLLDDGAPKETTAFESSQWNAAVGLTGGAAGRVGARGRSKPGARPDAAAIGAVDRFKDRDGFVQVGGDQLYKEPPRLVFPAPDVSWDWFDVRTSHLVAGNPVASNEPRVDFRATGAWLSAVTTGADGVAKVAIRLPDSTTQWRVQARAVTADTWVGEGRGSLRTKKPLQVDYEGPAFLTEGDAAELGIRLHNLGDAARQGHVELQRAFGPEPVTEARDVELAAHGDAIAAFAFRAEAAGRLGLTLRGAAGTDADAMQLVVPVQPFGTEITVGKSGSTKDRAAFSVSLPEGREYTAVRMLVDLGPDPGRDLLQAALGGGYVLRNCLQVEATNLARSSRGLAALSVLDYLERGGQAAKIDRDRLLGQAGAMLQSLVQAQLDDGSYAWVGQVQDLRSSCQVVRFLAACRRRNLATVDEPLNKAAEALLQALRNAATDARADLLWALAEAGRARFEALNGLHRARTSLSADNLARLALAWQAFGRPELAAETLEALRAVLPATALATVTTETVALAARALLAAEPRDVLGIAALAQLRSERRGAGWNTPEATAAAVAILTRVQGSNVGSPRATEITATINGRQLATTPAAAQGLDSTFAVPAEWVRTGANDVAIAVAGGGEAFFAVALVGFQREFRDADRNDAMVHVTRNYLAAPLRHGGRTIDSGFGVVTGGNYRSFENEITQLGVGEAGRVRVNFWVRREEDRKVVTPLVLEEPLPAGCSVAPASIAGGFDAVEVQPDRLVFYFREGVTSGSVAYELQARHPGSYQVLPSHIYSAMRPEFSGFGAVGALTVHPRGQGARDDYRLTPDELYAVGLAEFEAAQPLVEAERASHLAAAQEHLGQLLATWHKTEYRLRDDIYRDVMRMMLFTGIERGDARQVVRCFEELKDRFADLVIPFDKIVAVGRSYFDLGEFEAALLVFRATAEASFLKDAAVATTLDGLGEQKAGTSFLEKLLLTYPDLPTMRIARYSIGQKVAALAAGLSLTAPIDPRVGSSAELRRHALAAFREFVILYPEDPMAEEVSFAWATTELEGKDLKGALAVAEAALLRYPNSSFQDELLYTVGYADYALGEHEAAFRALERVATEQFPTVQGGIGDSDSKWHAIYLQGQIWHARGEVAKALAAYERVQDRFTDAGEAMDYFQNKLLSLPEIATFPTNQEPELELTFRNVDKVAVQVYQVDLMRLYLLERSLNDIRGIQLHGIKPLLTFDLALGDGRDYRNQTRRVPLALKGAGAYLCVVRGGDRIATGMVLASDLRIDTQEQLDVGRIRVNVKQGEVCVADAHVKVTGSGGGDFASGDTDLRGVFAADRLVGMATVIVKKGDQYAFFRGTGVHQPQAFRPAPQSAQNLPQALDNARQEKRRDARGFDALEQNYLQNRMQRQKQVEWLKTEVLDKQQRGVEVYRTK